MAYEHGGRAPVRRPAGRGRTRPGRAWTGCGSLLVAAILLAGCSSATSTSSSANSATGSAADATGPGALSTNGTFGSGGRGGWDCPGGTCTWGPDPAERAAFDALTPSGAVTAGPPGTSVGPRATSSTATPTTSPTGVVSEVEYLAVDDNRDFADYLTYREAFARTSGSEAVLPLAIEGRQLIRVLAADAKPVLGAAVDITDERGQNVAHLETGADGTVAFFPLPVPDATTGRRITYTATATKGASVAQVPVPPDAPTLEVTLPGAASGPVPAPIDVLFLLDTTTSMADELAELQSSFPGIAASAASRAGGAEVRFGLTTYRDRGDLFVTHTFDFTPDAGQFGAALAGVAVGGGGDTAEDLQAGLSAALTTPTWHKDAAVKLVLLITDAPPHLDYDGETTYVDSARTAASSGIRITGVGAAGIDARGTYVLRQLAQATRGRYVPLTRLGAPVPAGRPGSPPGELAAVIEHEIGAAGR